MPQATDPPEPRPDTRAGRTNVAAVEGCYQLVLWLIPVLDNLPRRQKFQLGDRMQSTALQVLETLIEAAYTRERSALLQQAIWSWKSCASGFGWPMSCNCWTSSATNTPPA